MFYNKLNILVTARLKEPRTSLKTSSILLSHGIFASEKFIQFSSQLENRLLCSLQKELHIVTVFVIPQITSWSLSI